MKRPLIILLLLLVVVGTIVLAARIYKLDRYRDHIETTYASEIPLIEQRAKELPGWEDWSVESYIRSGEIVHELEAVLTKPEIFGACWSSDGHHSVRSLKPMDTDGYSTHTWFGSHDKPRLHTLYYGTAFQGTPLLVYKGSVPTGVNKSYTITFYRDAIARNAAQH